MKNILVIDNEWPSPFSGKALRILNIFKRMKGCSLHFLYIGNKAPENVESYSFFSSISQMSAPEGETSFGGRLANFLFFRPGDDIRLSRRKDFLKIRADIEVIIREKKIDLCHIFSYFTIQYFSGLKDVSVIWDVGDSLYLDHIRRAKLEKDKQNFRYALYVQKILRFEREMIRSSDRTLFVSEKDAEIHNCMRSRVDVVFNGVDLEYFKPSTGSEEFPSLAFTGHMKFLPNVQAVAYFVREILPLVKKDFPLVKFFIVGAEPSKDVLALAGDGVEVTGEVPDIRPYLAKATVFVSPMVSGGGIKNKLLQAMAMAKPIISTSLGAEALVYRQGEDLLIADSPIDFAEGITRLLKDEALRQRVARNGFGLVKDTYSWEGVARKYEKLYENAKR